MKKTLEDISVLLLDIEGTICPISFVKDTLFPYALKALPQVLQTKWTDPEFQSYKSAFPDQAQSSPEAFLAHVQDLTARDVKIAYLKNLQGYLWESGYKSRAYSTPLFPDVIPALKTFVDPTLHSDPNQNHKPRRIAIYSSGSVFAQKLLFAHVQNPSSSSLSSSSTTAAEVEGNDVVDATGLISAWFDTINAGPKTERASYTRIADEIADDATSEESKSSPSHPTSVLFLSDNVNEVRAALEAGMKAVVVEREGNAPLSDEEKGEFRVIQSLDELELS